MTPTTIHFEDDDEKALCGASEPDVYTTNFYALVDCEECSAIVEK